MKKGYSVVEILVVVGVFAVLAILATQSISLSLRSSKKSDSVVNIKQELDNAADSVTRLLQTASVIYCPEATATPSVGFRDIGGNRGDIACLDTTNWLYILGNDTRIASSSAESINYNKRLTSTRVDITSCSFTCTTQNTQKYIDFSVTASARGISSAEGGTVTTSRNILVKDASRK
jgi:type II secretory pathway pseudopilin PulG